MPRPDSALAAAAFALVACAAVALVILHPYVTKDLRQPLGWDSMFYVWRARAVAVDGVDRIGAIRSGFPLLTAVLSRATGQSALTMVALIPAILAGITALGAAAMARVAVGIRGAWIPVVGFLTWAAFGPNEIPLHHFDNLLNVALVLAAFAAALAVVEGERGAAAVTLLLAAAGLAHWPFFAMALAVFVPAVVASLWLRSRGREPGHTDTRPELRLLGAATVSAAFTGLTVLVRPDTGWVGAQPGNLSTLLQRRVQTRLGEPVRFVSVPLAVSGALLLWRRAEEHADRPRSRRLLGLLVATWALVTLGAVLAQVAGLPVAGARVLSYFFPVTLLTGLLVWWGWGRLWTWGSGWPRVVAVIGLTAAIVGFGSLFWSAWSNRHPWVEERAVAQAATAGRYVALMAPDAEVVYLLDMRSPRDLATIGRWWLVIKASLPPGQVARAHLYVGNPEDFLSGRPSLPLGEGLPPGESDSPDPAGLGPPRGTANVAIVLQRYNTRGFARLRSEQPERVVGPGVLALRGPVLSIPLQAGAVATADTGGRSLVLVGAACVAILFVAGFGWSLALVTPDAVLRVLLAPAFGCATITLAALAWALAGIPMNGWWAVGPLAAAAAGGGIAAATMRGSRGSAQEGAVARESPARDAAE